MVQWLRGARPAPPEFHARWRHDADDKAAARIIEMLGRISNTGIPDAAAAYEFADALDSFLGYEASGREVTVRGDWISRILVPPLADIGGSRSGQYRSSLGLAHYVMTTVDVDRVAGDQLGGVCGERRGRDADILDGH